MAIWFLNLSIFFVCLFNKKQQHWNSDELIIWLSEKLAT